MRFQSLKIFVQENRWIIAATIFFIIWKFFLIGIMWDGRSIPPEPDDSYEYIAHIAAVSECRDGLFCPYTGVSLNNHSGFTYLSYGLVFGLIAKLFGMSAEQIFHITFYIGTVLLAAILPFYLSAFTSNRSLIAFSILFLTFYHGTGESHGFFWVVPSFFTLAILFIIYKFLVLEKPSLLSYASIALLSIVYTFTHPISLYLVFFFPLYLTIFFFLSKQYDVRLVKITIFVVAIVLASSFAQSQYLKHISQVNYYGLGYSLLQTKQLVGELTHVDSLTYQPEYSVIDTAGLTLFSSRLATLKATYFRYIIPHWIAIIPLLIALTILSLKRELRLLSFYLAAFIFFIGATMLHQFGFRSAILLWPATYILYAFAAWYIMEFLLHHRISFVRIPGIVFVTGTIVLFLIINAILSIVFNSNLNARNNYVFDQSFADHLSKIMRPDDRVSLNGSLIRTTKGAQLYLNGKVASATSNPKFLTIINPAPSEETVTPPSLTNRISSIIARMIGIPAAPAMPSHIEKNNPEGYMFNSRFGDIDIYERS